MLEDLLNHLCSVDDPRQAAKVEHRLVDVLAISVCAVLAGAESFEDIALYGASKRPWLSRHLALAGGVPSHDTIRRVLMLIDPLQFEDAFLAWTRAAFAPILDGADGPRQIAVDGKTLRRSFDRRGGRNPLHLVSAFATRAGVVLAQRQAAGGKSGAGGGGELGALPDLVAGLDLRGTLASLDAGFCHPRTATAITARGGDYLIALKGNCPSLHGPVRDWFDAHAFAPSIPAGDRLRPCADDIEERHGRLTRRRAFVADVETLVAWHPVARAAVDAWPGLRRMVAVEAIRMVEHPAPGAPRKATTQIRYALTSSNEPGERIAAAIRAHWAVENSLHWVLDTGFAEDLSRVRHENAAANLAVLRRIALNLVRADTSPGSLKAKRKRAAWDDNFMQKVVVGDVHA
jgi:predicted transposase YbfD/YdcC